MRLMRTHILHFLAVMEVDKGEPSFNFAYAALQNMS